MQAKHSLVRRLIFSAIVPLVVACAPVTAQPDTRMSVGGTIVNGELNSFYLSLGQYYGVPYRDVYYLHDRHIPDYDMPVVLFLSAHAHVAPGVIIDLRLGGMSWMDIGLRYGIGPDIYYVPVQSVYGPPFGHAYGHYQNRHRDQWGRIRLDDDDIVNLVNLRFISERYNYPPEEVMRMRSGGKGYVVIDDELNRRGNARNEQVRERYEMQQRQQQRDYRGDERRDDRGRPGAVPPGQQMNRDRYEMQQRQQQGDGQGRTYREQQRYEVQDRAGAPGRSDQRGQAPQRSGDDGRGKGRSKGDKGDSGDGGHDNKYRQDN